MFNIFLPYRTGVRNHLTEELLKTRGVVLMMEYEQLDISVNTQEEADIIQKSSITNIISTGRLNTFKYGPNQNDFIWFSIDTSFSDPFGLGNEGMENITKRTTNLIKAVEHTKEKFLIEMKAPLVTVMQDFNGIKGLIFQSNSVNFIIPYLSILDYSPSSIEALKDAIVTMSGENPVVIVELPDDLINEMNLRKVDITVEGYEPIKIIPLHLISETIEEFTMVVLGKSQ